MSETLADVQYSDADFAHDHRAIDFYRDHGCATVMDAFQIANILHTDGMVREASNFYRIAFDLHSKEPHIHPGPHILLHVSLLCLMKAGETPSDQDMKLLRGYSIPCYDYILAIKIAWRDGDYLQALRVLGNCYDEFHTGEECDRLCLEIALRVYWDQLTQRTLDHSQTEKNIPSKLFFYWDNNPPQEILDNFEYHRGHSGMEVRIFDQADGANWLYQNYGVEARELFLSMRHPAEAADFLRVHVIQKLGGWWMDADIRLRGDGHKMKVLSRRYSHVFLLTHDNVVHNDFFGSVANSPVLADILLSLYRNCYQYPGLYIAYKTGPGPFTRALNRVFHGAFNNVTDLPSMMVYDHTVFADMIEELDVDYKEIGNLG